MDTNPINQKARRSLEIFPGGSNGEFNLPPELTIVIQRGEGCELWDTAGKRYVDFSMGWGSALVGHANPAVTEAVIRQAPLGANFAYVTENSLALADEIVRASPACERLRFCASGTEATMYCLRLARAFTGRSKILKFEGAYHGANEVGVTSLFPSRLLDFPQPEPSSAGIGHLVSDHVLIAPFNDISTTQEIIERHGAGLAAVIAEPLHRCIPPEEGFLSSLREITKSHDLLLIFDEVVTGFRLAYGGAQEYYGVIPDLVAYGKALGGGYPIGAFGGRAEIMDLVREDRLGRETYVWTASTLGGNPISTAAGLAALSVYRQPNTYERLHAMGARFRTGLRKVLEAHQETAQVIGDGPLAQIIFSTDPVRDYRSTRSSDRTKSRVVMLALFEHGVFLNPMGTKLYLSIAHDERICEEFLDRFDDVLSQI
ncbi:MAG: aspartate aminotransferase family protein [bacterium]